MIRAVIFDLDGVLLDSEHVWDKARRAVAIENGGHWRDQATSDMQGMSSAEWSRYMVESLGVALDVRSVVSEVVDRVLASYEENLPVIPGAVEAVRRIAARWRLGLASSANRAVIERALSLAGLGDLFAVAVSSEEVARGKPAPDVYLEAARRLGEPPPGCAAVEDTVNGVRAALSAGMAVVAIPSDQFPPPEGVLGRVAAVLATIDELTVDLIGEIDARLESEARLDEQELESFPASDPHSDWAGPAS